MASYKTLIHKPDLSYLPVRPETILCGGAPAGLIKAPYKPWMSVTARLRSTAHVSINPK